MWKSATSSKLAGNHDVNMTPLIDVSLVLVVILLLATPLAFESSIAVRRTDQSGRTAEKPKDVKRVELSVLSEEKVRVNKTIVSREDFPGALQDVLRGEADAQVVVRCADQVSHGTFVSVLDEAKSSGAAQIAVVGR